MQHISHIPFTQGIATTVQNTVTQKVAYIKAALANETFQKIALFSTILGLLLVAANLDAIM